MNKDFDLVQEFLTYATKIDPSNCDRRLIIRGSLNTLINDTSRFGSRKGYTVFGEESEDDTPPESSFDWGTSTGTSVNLKAVDNKLKVYLATVGNVVIDSWETLDDTFSAVEFVFDTYWDNTEKIDRLIFCNGTDDLFDWSGAVATFDSLTPTTIKLQGSQTWAQRRFLTTGTRKIRIKDDSGTWHEATYTSGETTDTITVSDDLSAFSFTQGTPILQSIITRSNKPESNYLVDKLRVINNQLHLGSSRDRRVFVSQNDSIDDFSFSTPRLAGEGCIFTLDQVTTAIRTLSENPTYFTRDYIYKAEFKEITVSNTLTEAATCKRAKTAAGQGAISHDLSEEIENGIAFISKNQELLLLEDLSNTEKPVISNLSDTIKPDFDVLDFTGGHMKKHLNRIYISMPASGFCYIHEVRLRLDGTMARFWQPPQTLPVRRWAVIDDEIHGHSSITDNTYKLFDGYSDNGNPILCRAYLAKYYGGKQDRLKDCDEIINIGSISANTIIDVMYLFEGDKGEIEVISETINGADPTITYLLEEDPSLGNNALGDISLSGDDVEEPLPRFRAIHELNPKTFFDYEARFATNGADQQWEVSMSGPNASISPAHASGIKQ